MPNYVLRLYVTGQTPRSLQSVENLQRLCEKHLPGRFSLEVIDIYQQPALAAEGQIIAAPTLIKAMPLPLRRLVGDFSDAERVVLGLDLKKA
jgi:circadian clock protein KaiB